MDLEKSFKFAESNVSDYFTNFLAVLRRPALHFTPVRGERQEPSATWAAESDRFRFNPQLFSFALVSVAIGAVMQRFVLGADAVSLISRFIFVIAFWVLFGIITHWQCLAIGGHGSAVETVSVFLQVASIIYVVGGLAALIWKSIIPLIGPVVLFADRGTGFVILYEEPFLVYYLFQSIMLAVYLPLSLRPIHGLRRWQMMIIMIVMPLLVAACNIMFHISRNSLTEPLPPLLA